MRLGGVGSSCSGVIGCAQCSVWALPRVSLAVRFWLGTRKGGEAQRGRLLGGIVPDKSTRAGGGLVPSAFGALLRPQRNKGDECPDDADR
jgi:hypothetical protein